MTPSQVAVALFALTQIPKRRQGARRHRTATDSAQALGTGIGRHRATAQRGAGRRAVRALACLSLLALAGLLTAPVAMGAFTHPFLSEFTGSDTPQGSLGSEADKVALRQSTGNVYVIATSQGVTPAPRLLSTRPQSKTGNHEMLWCCGAIREQQSYIREITGARTSDSGDYVDF
jgi:hypothetical protein